MSLNCDEHDIKNAIKQHKIKKGSNQFKALSRDKLELFEKKETHAVPKVGKYNPKHQLV